MDSIGRADANFEGAAVVALGSNLGGTRGSSLANLEDALGRFSAEGLRLLARSSWWRSAAWPDPSGPAFLNGVAMVATDLSPPDALAALHRIEAALGRERAQKNAPRTLDLDLIAFGRLAGEFDGLVLPHPRAAERLFVMGPLAEVAPGWRHPTLGLAAAELAASATVGRDARPAD